MWASKPFENLAMKLNNFHSFTGPDSKRRFDEKGPLTFVFIFQFFFTCELEKI